MSRSEKHSHRNYSKFDNMSTEVLKEMLKQDSYLSEDEESDMDLILHIMEVIEKREKKQLSEKFANVDDAWKSFNDYYRPSAADGTSLYEDDENVDAALVSDIKPTPFKPFEHPPKSKIQGFLRVACVAAVVIGILFAGSMTAYALGYDIWGAVAQWSKETFGFVSQQYDSPQEALSKPDNRNFPDLQSAFDEYGITVKAVPSYMPDGFELTEFNVSDMGNSAVFTAVYTSGDVTIILDYTLNADSGISEYEKDNLSPEIYVVSGIEHYIMTNMGKYLAVWRNGSFEGSISGLNSNEELLKMIDSIYEE